MCGCRAQIFRQLVHHSTLMSITDEALHYRGCSPPLQVYGEFITSNPRADVSIKVGGRPCPITNVASFVTGGVTVSSNLLLLARAWQVFAWLVCDR